MPFKGTLTGNLGKDPAIRFTQNGRPVLDLTVGCTPRRKNKDTGQWENQGENLWLKASIWDNEAEKWAERLRQGDSVTIEGVLTKRAYTRNDGTQGETLELAYPRILGYDPKQPTQQPAAVNTHYGAPAGGTAGDPWATNQPTTTSEPPF